MKQVKPSRPSKSAPGAKGNESGAATAKEPNQKSKLFNYSTEKVFSLLMAFGQQRRSMSLPEMAEATGIGKSAAQRFSHTLEDLGFLKKDSETKRFVLTPKVLELGFRYIYADPLIGYAEPYLADLHMRTKESVNLWRPSGSDMICVTRFPGARQLVAPMTLGQRLPMYCSSAGRAYLSSLPDDEVHDLLDASTFEARLPTTVTDPDEIRRLVQQAKTDGYATAFQQYFPTDLAFGAPIVDASGRGLGAINLSVSSTRLSEEKAMKTFPALVRETALAISTNLRDQSEVI